jgi:hypothetical protein
VVTQFIPPSAQVNSEILNQYETKEEATLRRRIERLKAEERSLRVHRQKLESQPRLLVLWRMIKRVESMGATPKAR